MEETRLWRGGGLEVDRVNGWKLRGENLEVKGKREKERLKVMWKGSMKRPKE